MTEPRKLRVFLCHSSQDKPIVRELYQRLLAEGWIDPWLDEEKLLPGQDWDMEIEKTVEASDAVIVCLSNNSVTKEGYIQKEIRKVLDISAQKPEGTIFIIPLRLDDCEPPRRLASWHYADYFPRDQRDVSYQRLIQSLKIRSDNQIKSTKQTTFSKSEKVQKVILPSHKHNYHTALLSEEVSKASASGVNFLVAKLQWGKDDVGYSLHAEPTSYSTYGMQTTDFLVYLGLKRENCPFVTHRECYTTWVDSEFRVSEFSQKFGEAFGLFEKAAKLLENCGNILEQPEGWGYFYNKISQGRSSRQIYSGGGDGHTSNQPKILKEIEDDYFYYKLSWIETGASKGWTFHYRLKDISDRHLFPALNFLRLNNFKECPFFDFEECFWMYIAHQSKGDAFFDSNAEFIHQAFNATRNNFPLALQMLMQSNGLVFPFGFELLKV